MGMVEFIGMIKVNIIRGKDLVVRDLVTSDPYVILTLGHQVRKLAYEICLSDAATRLMFSCLTLQLFFLLFQSVRTRVIKSSLNPVWNEMLMLSIPDPVPSLRIVSRHFEVKFTQSRKFLQLIFFLSCILLTTNITVIDISRSLLDGVLISP